MHHNHIGVRKSLTNLNQGSFKLMDKNMQACKD